jgi:hypothetical protein
MNYFPFEEYDKIIIYAIGFNIENQYFIKFFNYLKYDYQNNIRKKFHNELEEIDVRIINNDEINNYDINKIDCFMYLHPISIKRNNFSYNRYHWHNYNRLCDLSLNVQFKSEKKHEIWLNTIQKDRYGFKEHFTEDINEYFNSIILKITRQEKIKSLYI